MSRLHLVSVGMGTAAQALAASRGAGNLNGRVDCQTEIETPLGGFLFDLFEKRFVDVHEMKVLWSCLDNPERWESSERFDRIENEIHRLCMLDSKELIEYSRSHLRRVRIEQWLQIPLEIFAETLEGYYKRHRLSLNANRTFLLHAIFVAFIVTP